MAVFEYTGQLSTGGAFNGTIEAASHDVALLELQEMNVQVVGLAVTAHVRAARPLSRADLMYFNQQLASLAESGMALDQGLRCMAKDLQSGRLRRVVEELAADLESGIPLEQAVKKRENLFPPLYVEVLKAGMKNNQLGATLCNFNTHLSLIDAGRQLFWEAAIYPLIVLCLGLLLMTVFLIFIVPQFVEVTTDFGIQLPAPTRGLIQLSTHWLAVAISGCGFVLIAIIFWKILGSTEAGRKRQAIILLHTPGLAGLYRQSLVARFAQASALGARAGHDLPNILRLAAGATGNALLAEDAEQLSRAIEGGELPMQAALRTKILPPIFGYTAQIAGARGELTAALIEMARNMDMLIRHRMLLVKAILTPILVLLVGSLIGLGVLATFAPIFSLIQSLTGGGS